MTLLNSFAKKALPIMMLVLAVANSVMGQTVSPTRRPTVRPTRKPSNKPVHIYVDEEPVLLTMQEKQGIVATLTVLLFILMALDFTGPEVLFLIALMICCLAQILSLSETLSGTILIGDCFFLFLTILIIRRVL